MRLVDVHCHLTDEELINNIDEVIERAKRAGVIAVVTSTLESGEVERALGLTKRYQGYVYLTVGCDPQILDRGEVERIKGLLEELRDKVVGVGEVGLDYFLIREEGLRLKQLEIFKGWITLAKRLDLPLVVHSRSAGKYAIATLLECGYTRVLMHAFDGKPSYAKKGVKEGMLFSIPTSVWRSRQKQKLASAIPLENLVLETDSPVLSPQKGTVNEPANITYAARKVAEIKGIEVDEVAEITTANARTFYEI